MQRILANKLNKIAENMPKKRLYVKHFFTGLLRLILGLKVVCIVTILVDARFIPRCSKSNAKHINRHN